MLTVDYGGGGLVVDYVIKILFKPIFVVIPIGQFSLIL